MIGEIDVHLHPSWQRKVIGKLRELFPNVQFVVTTHSPLVLSNLYENPIFEDKDKTSKVYDLENGNVSELLHYRGKAIKDVMYNIFGIESRPKITQKKIDNLSDAIVYKQEQKAEKLLKELIAVLGENDDAVLDAIDLLEEIEDEL